jgi:hypothetical protein
MTLADSEIVITFDGERLTLRPTLRAAMRLESRFGGFHKILKALAEQNITVMSALVEECSEWPCVLGDFLAGDPSKPMAYKVGRLVESFMALTLRLADIDEEELAKESDASADDRTSYAEHHARLFKLATGWLGWSPEEAWNATPAEIKAAYAGRLDMLKAIFGAGEGKKTPAQSEAAFAAFLRARAI